MAFLVSPGVQVREFDLTTVVPAVSTTEGVIGGVFRWGPIGERVLIDSETELVKRFGKPANLNAETWLTAASFLSYGNRLYVSRAANTVGLSPRANVNTTSNSSILTLNANTVIGLGIAEGMTIISSSNGGVTVGTVVESIINSTAFHVSTNSDVTATRTESEIQLVSNTAFTAIGTANSVALVNSVAGQIAKNEVDFKDKLETGSFDDNVVFIAKYPGEVGNSLRISVCGNPDGFNSTINLASAAVLVDSASIDVQFVTGSNTAKVTIVGASNTDVEATSDALIALINVNDKIEAGNNVLGTQYLKVSAVSNTVTYGNTQVNAYLIATRNNTTILVANSSGEIDAGYANTNGMYSGMIINSGNTYLENAVVNSVINAVAFTVETAPTINLAFEEHSLNPVRSFDINFEDRYTLSEDFTFSSTSANTRVLSRFWEFHNAVDSAPGQSDYNINFGNSAITSDEMHVVVVDEGGKFTGVPGTVLEVYRAVSRGTNAKTVDGASNYWKTVINDSSQYIYAVNDIEQSGGVARSASAEDLVDSTLETANYQLSLGKDGKDETNIELSLLMGAYDLYKSAEDVDISLLLQGKPRSYQLANYLIDNIAETRKDCIVLVSPQKSDVVNNTGYEAEAIVSFRNNLRSTSYAVLDSGYKYMYDRYNDIYRWVPLNGDTAGLCVRTDYTNDPWWSPAGFNRGQIKNVVKLAFNPRQSERDTLYKAGVNPVVTFPGQGTILYGDKTLLAKPSAFDRINVRRLFIVLEKAIATASKFTLFEFNDAFTRSQFKNLVVPYLRDVQGRRGITDFLVVCDETNNTPEVIDRNEFVGDIYIKPARSINFIQLNFVAVRTGVAFSEVVGKF